MKNNNWKKRIITLLIFVLGGVLFSLNNNVYAEDVHVSDYNTLSSNLKVVGNNVILDDDITFNSAIDIRSIRSSGEIVLDLNGHDLICNAGISTAMINIMTNSYQITLKIVDNKANGVTSHGFINSEDNKTNNRNCRAIQILSNTNKISLNIDSVKFDGFRHTASGPAINVIGYQYLRNENEVPNIDIRNSTFTNNVINGRYGGGAMNFQNSNVSLTNNVIENNIAGNNNTSSAPSNGGGIAFLHSHIKMINNSISHNYADSGGGIYIQTTPGDTIISQPVILLKGNKINYNEVNTTKDDSKFGVGGGLQISLEPSTNVDFKIESGEFIGNIAKDGGAIYHGVVWANNKNSYNDSSKTIYLQKALITGNKAARGGGIWLCPQAYLLMHATLGGAIYGNTATGTFSNAQSGLLQSAGDDIHYEGSDGDDKQYEYWNRSSITVSDRTWSGNLINWYKDEKNNRYSASNRILASKDYYTNTTNTVSLHGEIETDQEDATIIIKDNVATQRGGGIFTNNLIVIGEDEDIDIEVNKEFLKDGQPYNKIADEVKIYINLYRIDEDGNEVLLDKNVELNKDNEFKYTFTDLPSKYVDEENNEHNYKYDIREVDTSNQVSNTCTSLNREKTSCTITNEYVAPPVDFVPSVEKKVTGKTKPKKDASFTFEISSEEQDGVELPKNTKVTVKGEGRVNFGNIKITKAGEYNFTIKEVLGNNLDYKYDLSVWMVKVVVGENTENGTLYIDSIKYYKKNKEYEKVIFENEYNPSTGDPLLSNVSNFIISGFVILGISMIKRKIYN